MGAPCATCSCLPAARSVALVGACGAGSVLLGAFCLLPFAFCLVFCCLPRFSACLSLLARWVGFWCPWRGGVHRGRASLGLVLPLGEADMRLLLLGAVWCRLFAFCALRCALRFSALVAPPAPWCHLALAFCFLCLAFCAALFCACGSLSFCIA